MAGDSSQIRDPDDETFRALMEGKSEDDGAGKFGGSVLKRTSIAEQVTSRITAMIKSGNLKPGERLPTEAQMGVAFGISRPPLREALKALTLMGVLESRQGGRYTVTDLSPSRLIEPFSVMLSVNEYDIDKHFDARALVDLELVRLCCARATPADRDKIRRLAEEGHAFYDDPVAFRLLDIEFHRALNEAAHNEYLTAVAQGLYDVGLDIRRIAIALPGVIRISVGQHSEIAQAVLAGDAEAACEAYRRHNEHVRETTARSIALSRDEHGQAASDDHD